MKFKDFLHEGIMDDKENEKFSMKAKVNGKDYSAKRMNGGYYYYNDVTKKWNPVSKSSVTFTEKEKKVGAPSFQQKNQKSSTYNANKTDGATPEVEEKK